MAERNASAWADDADGPGTQSWIIQDSKGLTYEPASEPQHIPVKELPVLLRQMAERNGSALADDADDEAADAVS